MGALDADLSNDLSKKQAAKRHPRHVRVKQYSAPTRDELRHQWLWRFLARIAGEGRDGHPRPPVVRPCAGRARRGLRDETVLAATEEGLARHGRRAP